MGAIVYITLVFVDIFRGLFPIQKFARLVIPPSRSISLVDGQGKRYHTLERMVRQNVFRSRCFVVGWNESRVTDLYKRILLSVIIYFGTKAAKTKYSYFHCLHCYSSKGLQ